MSNGSNPDFILYPVDQIREVAAQILVQADLAQQQHATIWQQIQTWLDTNDDNGYIASVLKPHEKRMRDSYAWQIQLATALFDAVDQVESYDDQNSQNFTPRTHGPF